MADYYQVLGVSSKASETEIRAAYRQKAKLYHPDLNKSPDAHSMFILLTLAYETLVNPASRQRYDLKTNANTTSSYNDWLKAKKAIEEFEARMRHYEFLKNRERFRQSPYYMLAIWVTQIARVVSCTFGAIVIAISLYLIFDFHFMLIFLLLPFICGGVYLIKWTNDWYKETRRYF
jgi:curved DNA-binding protein CbpA